MADSGFSVLTGPVMGAAARLADNWRFHAPVLLLLAGFAVVAWCINSSRDLWLDEVETLIWAYSPLGEIHTRAGENNHTALYFWLMHFWVKGGDSETWLKVPTLIMFLATVPLVYALGRIIRSPLTGLTAAALFVTSPYATYYAGEVRPYMLLALLAAANFLCLARLVAIHRASGPVYPFILSLRRIGDGEERAGIIRQNLLWLGVVTFTFLLMITHMSAATMPLVVALASAGAVPFLKRRRPFAASVALALLAVSVLYLALPFGLRAFLLAPGTLTPTPFVDTLKFTADVWFENPWQLVVLLPFLLLVLRRRPDDRHWIVFCLLLLLTLPAVMVFHDLLADDSVYRKRALIWTIVPFCVLAALALPHFGRAAVVVVVLFVVLNFHSTQPDLGWEKSGWGTAAKSVRAQKGPEDAVMVCPRYFELLYRLYEYPELEFGQWPDRGYYYTWQRDLELPVPRKGGQASRPFGENDRVWSLTNLAQQRRGLCDAGQHRAMMLGEGFQLTAREWYSSMLVERFDRKVSPGEEPQPVAYPSGRQ